MKFLFALGNDNQMKPLRAIARKVRSHQVFKTPLSKVKLPFISKVMHVISKIVKTMTMYSFKPKADGRRE